MKYISHSIIYIILVLFNGSLLAQSVAQNGVGIRSSSVMSPIRGKSISFTLWYPAQNDGTAELYGDSKIFKGVPILRNASFAAGTFPIVLMSHGGLRSNPALSGWIASSIAGRGNIVVVVHPPKLGPNDALIASREVWIRPSDLSITLDAVLNDAALASHIQPQKVAALGFFLGGTTVLQLAGISLDVASYKRSCDIPNTGPDCNWFAEHAVNLHAIDEAELSRPVIDPRIGAVIAVNPELSNSMTIDSLRSVTTPFRIINLGNQSSIPVGLDASMLEKQLSSEQYVSLPELIPFDVFNLCTAQAIEILQEDGEDETICMQGNNKLRTDSHILIAEAIDMALMQID